MFTWANYEYESQRYENLRREAAQERLIRQAIPRRPARTRPYRRALVWLGRQFTAWGCRLTEQYGGITDTASPTSSIDWVGWTSLLRK